MHYGFMQLDNALSELAKSDSSIEFAEHVRSRFNEVIVVVNQLKVQADCEELCKEDKKYFG